MSSISLLPREQVPHDNLANKAMEATPTDLYQPPNIESHDLKVYEVGGKSLSLAPFIFPDQIHEKLSEVACAINSDYRNKELVLLVVLSGAIVVAADLIRKLEMPCSMEVVQAASYDGEQRKQLTVKEFNGDRLTGKDVLIVDDIFDSGATLSAIRDKVLENNPQSVKSFTLLKKHTEHVTAYRPDYFALHIPNKYVVGHGFDYDGFLRNLPLIYTLEEARSL